MSCCKVPRARYCHRPGCQWAPESLARDAETAAGLEVGDKVWFQGERQGYTVRARNDRYVICTKPFNARRTVLYSVIDCELGVRGTDNCYGIGYETQEQIDEAMRWFEKGRAEVSHRNHVYLYIDKVANGTRLDRMERAA